MAPPLILWAFRKEKKISYKTKTKVSEHKEGGDKE
jgi:hypothetical protein